MRIVDLSHVLRSGMAQFPGDHPPPRILRRLDHDRDGHQSSALEIGCHLGTHIDTPLHFRAGQPGLEAMPPEAFWGWAVVVDAPAGERPGPLGPEILAGRDLDGVDFLLIRTGWSRHWGSDRYYRDWPTVGPELARRLAGLRLKGVGLDGPSLDPLHGRESHDLLAAAGLINIENLTNLEALPDSGFEFAALPLRLEGAEGSPVRAVALLRGAGAERAERAQR